MIARHLIVSGRVQGVFYRKWTIATARGLGLSGWVRNLGNGDVEIFATGDQRPLNELIRLCWKGPPAAEVQQVTVRKADPEPLQGFTKRPSLPPS